ncbi:MAG: MFS transporter [Deltaproteobacteria bacterium]|nr:MAG: MFS transporter [Deltaproteobacteria bacterium]
MAKNKNNPKIFYGWWIVLASTIARAFSGGFFYYGFSAFFMPLVREFGWSRTALSGAFSLSRIEGGLLGPIGGFLVDKLGPRKIMFFGITLMGAGFILLSRIDSLIAFYLVFVLCVSVGSTVGIHRTTIVAIANWFINKRGIAIGIGTSGIGLGGMLVPILAWLIVQYGWRPTTVIIGLSIWIIGIPLSLVMRHRPEQYGYLADGEVKEEIVMRREPEVDEVEHHSFTNSAKVRISNSNIDFTPRQALRTTIFWLLALIFGLRQFVVSAIVIHQIPFLIGIGISPELAAAMLGSIGIISIVGRLVFGRLGDILEKRHLMAICLGLTALGCLILANAQTCWHVIPFLVIYPPAYGGGMTLMNAIRGEYFGRQYFGTISGFMDLVQMFGIVFGTVFAGWIFDVTGSYRLAFVSFAIAAAAAMMLMLIARCPVPTPCESCIRERSSICH